MLFKNKDKQDRLAAVLGNTLQAAPADIAGRSPWADARGRFLRNKAAVFSLGLLTFITVCCIVGPWLLPNAFDAADWDAMSLPPMLKGWHFFGTDESGRDLLVRSLVGGRVSLMVGFLATLSAVTLGIVWGATAGFIGGRVDAFMMRVVDMMYAVPYLLIAILMVTIFGRAFYLVVITITVFSWMDMARVVRGQTLSLRSKEFIEAARALGVPTRRIIFQHIVPNLSGHRGDLHHRHRAGGDPGGVRAVLSGPGHTGADDQLGRADSRRRLRHGGLVVDAALSGRLAVADALLL
jgi:oligopeptide transport system permease protein